MTLQHLRLWQTLSRIPSLRAPRRAWQAELGEHWELCHQFLSATPDLAAWTLASDGVTACDVVEHDDGTFVGINRLQGETFDVERNELTICTLSIAKLAITLMPLIGGRAESLSTIPNGSVQKLGRLSPRFASTTMHFHARTDQTSLIETAMSVGAKTVLLVPSLAGTGIDLGSIERTFEVTVIAADEVFFIQEGTVVASTAALAELRYRLGLGDDSPPNSFRMTGDHWEICFQKTRFVLSDAIGMWYLAEFLSRPGKTLSPVELENARTGIAARSSTSGTGEAFDEEARRDYKRRLADLGARIAESERNNDAGTLETLQTEQYEILSQLQKDSGKNGKARVLTDESKSRKNVRQAVTRDIKRIAEHHDDLAEHLKLAFKGNAMCYRPDADPNWEF
ncbi:hypothetical protein FHS27_000753 [Rhodopirellula rubra]|uniref:Uncharacterized protein n=1 Tax=Aporhodopirellula rubra TaxID=980271 RepID=A0A7W5DUY4_9BACT|nr:hypothetical protein [Aporhodopirellula rubra]MBB3204986.1 hypothetical protein [Aporhodopirellula rubra]